MRKSEGWEDNYQKSTFSSQPNKMCFQVILYGVDTWERQRKYSAQVWTLLWEGVQPAYTANKDSLLNPNYILP